MSVQRPDLKEAGEPAPVGETSELTGRVPALEAPDEHVVHHQCGECKKKPQEASCGLHHDYRQDYTCHCEDQKEHQIAALDPEE